MSMRQSGWKTLVVAAALIVAVLVGSAWMLIGDQQRRNSRALTRELLSSARVLREALRSEPNALNVEHAAGIVHILQTPETRIIVLAADGRALLNTDGSPELASGLLAAPEVVQALHIGAGESTRTLADDPHPNRTVAVRAGNDDGLLGVVWMARPLRTIAVTWHSLAQILAVLGATALVSILALAATLTRARTRLLRRLTETARNLSAGDLSAKAGIGGEDEYAALSAALNRMREQLAAHADVIERQRATLDSLVEQLHEGVVVVRPDGRVAIINPAAVRLLNPRAGAASEARGMVGLPLEQCIPQHELQQMLRQAPSESEHAPAEPLREARVEVDAPSGEAHLLARVSEIGLPDESGPPRGTAPARVLVLTDITKLAHLLRVKTDFVANASHELRTPLSAIRASVDTLLQIDPAREADAARGFLEAVDRQSRRLDALVSDLLALSRLESPSARYEPNSLNLAVELDGVYSRFADRLAAGEIAWEVSGASSSGPQVTTQQKLLRLVLDNLIDNAIKFTPHGGHIRVTCGEAAEWIAIEVQDDGIGIAPGEQERVFERFYQVEPARSGAECGTGLGLSIVRHAVAGMGGTLSLTSREGEGTCVTFRIRKRP